MFVSRITKQSLLPANTLCANAKEWRTNSLTVINRIFRKKAFEQGLMSRYRLVDALFVIVVHSFVSLVVIKSTKIDFLNGKTVLDCWLDCPGQSRLFESFVHMSFKSFAVVAKILRLTWTVGTSSSWIGTYNCSTFCEFGLIKNHTHTQKKMKPPPHT